MEGEYILELRNIEKSFPGVKALDRACLYLRRGEVLALMGGNGAGKSTLMNVLFGILHKDAGTVIYEGKEVDFADPGDAIRAGISMVHQELQPIPDRSVAENLFMGRFPLKKALGVLDIVDHNKMNEDAKVILKKVHLDVSPETSLRELSIGQMQLVEIARAVSTECRVLILDEPTSALTGLEAQTLFTLIGELKNQGVAIIYISHRMEEIFEISDEIAVMRDGMYVGTWKTEETDAGSVIENMLGHTLGHIYPERRSAIGETILKVENYTSIYPMSFKDCSFELRRGEILGVSGLVGAQRTELMEAIFGLRAIRAGRLTIKGEITQIRNPADAISNGIALLTEDRLNSGIFKELSVVDNMAISSYEKHLEAGMMIDSRAVNELVLKNTERMKIKTASLLSRIVTLSGGNQQKVLIGRILANEPDIFIFDEPTRGIDVGARHEIYCIMAELCAEGRSIIMVSGDMAELIGMSDRIMVMCNGRITGLVERENMTERNIMNLSFRFGKKE